MAAAPRYNPKTGVLIPPLGPYLSPHLLYVVHGILPGGEVWTIGLRTEAATPPSSELKLLADYASRRFAAMGTPADGFRTMNPAGESFTGVTVRALDVNGVTTDLAESASINQPGQASAQTAPDQTAICITLLTNKPGRSGKGRVFLPLLAPVFDAQTGRLAATNRNALQNGMSTFIASLNNWDLTDTGPEPATMYSIAIQSRTTHQAGAPVAYVSVGDVPDTIRGRRNKLKESYQVGGAILPPAGA